MFLVVREQVKTFRSTGLEYDGPDPARIGEHYDLMMPFEAVRILTLVSPLLDPPEGGGEDIDGRKQSAFWPRVGGQLFKFHVSATDTDGNVADMAMPLIFVGKELADDEYPQTIIPTDVKTRYETDVWPGTTTLRSTVPLGGQKVAFAASGEPDDTAYAVESLTFGVAVPTVAKTYKDLTPKKVRFFPVVRGR